MGNRCIPSCASLQRLLPFKPPIFFLLSRPESRSPDEPERGPEGRVRGPCWQSRSFQTSRVRRQGRRPGRSRSLAALRNASKRSLGCSLLFLAFASRSARASFALLLHELIACTQTQTLRLSLAAFLSETGAPQPSRSTTAQAITGSLKLEKGSLVEGGV